MPEDKDARYRRVLAKQLVMNQQTWASLRSHGVTEGSELRLGFAYRAPTRAAAESLQAVIQDQTDYEVGVESEGSLLSKSWSVVGQTQPTSISLPILNQWVDWMVTAGIHQGCEFDGWGAEI